jgi:hypothetical protein
VVEAVTQIPQASTPIGTPIQWDVTNLVNAWLHASFPNDGILLRDPTSAGVFRGVGFASRENGTYEGPRLFVHVEPDDDTDGIATVVEDAAPNDGDFNDDKVLDSVQPQVASTPIKQIYPVSADLGYSSFVVIDPATVDPDARAIIDLEAKMATTASDAQLANLELQRLLQDQQQTLQILSNISKELSDQALSITRKIAGAAPMHRGGAPTTIVAVRHPIGMTGAMPNAWLNYGPTADDPTPHYYEFAWDGTTGARFVPGGVLLYYVDGGRGDHDGVADGVITTDGLAVVRGNRCPLGQGYWKQHPWTWAVAALTLGQVSYRQGALVDLLGRPVRGDASLILAKELIAAKLNVARGVPDAALAPTIAAADALLATFPGALPYGVKPGSPKGFVMLLYATVLAIENEVGVPGCGW